MTLRQLLIGVIFAAATLASAQAKSPTMADVAPQLRKNAECMFRVLRTVPGIDHVRLGVENDQNWLHPYLEYRAKADERGFRPTMRYNAERACTADNRHNWCSRFVVLLSGLTSPGKEPSDWGTRDINKKWKSACGVTAVGFFI